MRVFSSDARLKHLAVRRKPLPDGIYWTIFGLLILIAASIRAFWIYVLEVPYVTPDTHSYISPILTHWLLPFSQMRTGGTSMFISAALAIFHRPAGILVFNAILSIGSAALLAIAVKTVLRQKVLSLVILLIVTFTAKNITFEFYLMSEHYARILYIVWAALMLWTFQYPDRAWIAALAGLSVAMNILVKPTAIVLVVATVIAFIAVPLTLRRRRGAIAASAAVFLAAVLVPLTGYMLAFQERYGTFNLTQYNGINQFSHVGHLTVLDGGKHAKLKERLKPLLGLYAANYAARGDYQPNWLIYGSFTEELRRDFGDKSPARTVGEYVREQYGSTNYRWMNEVYSDLAMEAMLAHPVEYLRFAFERALFLWRGLSFDYYVVRPSPEGFQAHREDRAIQRNWYYQLYGEIPPCGAGSVVPVKASGPLVSLFHGPIADCRALPYEDPAVRKVAQWVDDTYKRVTKPVREYLHILAYAGAVSALVAGVLLLLLRGCRVLKMYGYGLLLALVLLGYTMLHGLINVAEVQRMMTNVQDYVVIASLAFFVSAVMSIKRLLLYAILVRRRRKMLSPA